MIAQLPKREESRLPEKSVPKMKVGVIAPNIPLEKIKIVLPKIPELQLGIPSQSMSFSAWAPASNTPTNNRSYRIEDFWPRENPYSWLLQDTDEKRRKQAPRLMSMHDFILEGMRRLDDLHILIQPESLISDLKRLWYAYEGEALESEIYKRYLAMNIISKDLGLKPPWDFKRRFTHDEPLFTSLDPSLSQREESDI